MMHSLRFFLILMLLAACCPVGHASSIFNFSGTFNWDGTFQEFSYTAPVSGEVDAFTTSFATGGFEPVLSLFDSTGSFLFDAVANYGTDGYSSPTDVPPAGCDANPCDLGAQDAYLTWDAAAGETYTVVLTVNPNTPSVPQGIPGVFDPTNPAASYTYAVSGATFTSDFYGETPGTSFWYEWGVQRTGDWAVTIQGPSGLQATQLPEPRSSLTLLGGGILLSAGLLRRRRSRS